MKQQKKTIKLIIAIVAGFLGLMLMNYGINNTVKFFGIVIFIVGLSILLRGRTK